MNNGQQLSKSKLISQINWDYDFSENELLSLINDKGNLSNMRLCFFIESLQVFTIEELIFLWGLDEAKKIYILLESGKEFFQRNYALNGMCY